MALKAWYKLDGNTNDSSGNGLNAIGYSGTFVEGIIGQGLSGNGSSNYFEHPQFFSTSVNYWNVSFWINPATGASGFLASPNSGGIDHRLSYSSNQHVSLNFIPAADSSSDTISSTNGSVPFNTWTHVSINANNYDVEIYINGKLNARKTMAYNLVWSGSWEWLRRPNGTFYVAAILDDIRLYDEPLSPGEIKKIAKAEVLHYNFNQLEEPTTNILPNINFENRTYGTNYTASGWGGDEGYFTYYANGGYRDQPYMKLTRTLDGTGGTYHDNFQYYTLTEGKTYTMSAWMKTNQTAYGTNGYILSFNRTDNLYLIGSGITLTQEWQLYSFTITVGSGQGGTYQIRTIAYTSADAEIYWSNIQVEEKPYATPFVNGTRIGKIIDTTDYQNHATLDTNTPQWIEDTKVGTGAYQFNGSTTYIYPDTNLYQIYKRFTASAWIKLDTAPTETNVGYVIVQQYGGGGWILSVRGTDSKLQFRHHRDTANGFTTAYNLLSTSSLSTNQWYHIAATDDGSVARIYINGVLNNSFTISSIIPGPSNSTIRIGTFNGTYANLDGTIGELSIASKAFTAEEILDEYQTRGEFYKNGQIYLKELKLYSNRDEEIDNNNLVLNGRGEFGDLTNFSGFTGWDATEKAFYSTGSYNTVVLDRYIEMQGNGINKFDQYILEGEHKQISGTMSRYYFMILCYDKDKNFINNYNVTETTTAARTTLAQALNPGDTVLYLTSSSNWSTAGNGSYYYTQQFAIFPDGHEYPDYTYSRIHGRYLSVSGNTLNLQSAWAGDTIPAGSRIMNTRDGGTFSYIAAGNALMTTDWVKRSATTSATENDGSVRAGTKYIKVGWLMNYTSGVNTGYVRNVKFYNITNPDQPTLFDIDEPKVDPSGSGNYNDFSTVGITQGLIGYWPFEKNANDYSGNQKQGTFVGSVPIVYDSKTPTINLTGSVSNYVEIDPTLVTSLESFTISYWAKFTNIGKSLNTVFHGSVGGGNDISTEHRATFFRMFINGAVTPNISHSPSNNVWYHFVITRSGSVLTLYVNGELQGTTTCNQSPVTIPTTGHIIIGQEQDANGGGFDAGQSFEGYLAHLKVFDRALDAKETKIEYNTMFNNELQITKEGILYAKDIIQY